MTAPSTVAPARPWGGYGLALLRVVLGITWLHEAAWKIPPDFGRSSGSGLWDWTNRALENPVFGPYNWVVENVVIPNFTFFGWLVFLTEATLGGLLIFGVAARLAGVLGALMALPIAFSVLNVSGEWSYAYYIYIAAHLAVAGGAAGRTLGVDAVVRETPPDGRAATRIMRRLS